MKKYLTKDFYLSALLMGHGFRLIDSESKQEGVYFILENKDDELLNTLLTDFVNYQATVNLKKFTSAMARLRKELDKHK